MKLDKKIVVAVVGLSFATLSSLAQIKDASQVDSLKNSFYNSLLDEGSFPKKQSRTLEQFNVSGYYRFVTNYRHLDIAYPHLRKNPNNIFVGDDSQIPS